MSDYSPTSNYTLTLSNLTNCTIDLRDTGAATLTSLHVHNLSNCVLFAHVDGSALLTFVARSILVLTVRQFRLHSSTGVAVLLDVGSLPVIEKCQQVFFGPHGESDKYAQVQDFDWVRGGPSPHWSVMTDEQVSEVQRAISNPADHAVSTVPFLQD